MSALIGNNVDKLLNLVCGKIHDMRQKELNYEEIRYIKNKIKTINPGIFSGRKLADVVSVISEVYLEDLKKLETYNIKENVDVHEYLVKSIGESETVGVEVKTKPEKNLDGLLQISKAPIKKTYLLLDRRYQSAEGNNSTLFTWNVVTTSGTFDKYSSAVSSIELKNIVAIRLYPFKFPNTPRVFGNDNTLSVEIVELNNQAYIAAAFYKRFHFSFNIFRQNPLYGTSYTGTQEPFKTSDLSDKGAVINFREPIAKLDNLSIRFGNPFNTLTLNPDKLPATVSASGIQTLVDFGTTPHYCAVGDVITFKNFNTTIPATDYDIIVSINDENGWYITAITSTTVTVDRDLTGLVGVINSNPTTILLDAKRFILRLEIDYVDDSNKQ